ncbi:hypothetical protein GCM10023158_21690 [Gluconacetobacter tumulicola]
MLGGRTPGFVDRGRKAGAGSGDVGGMRNGEGSRTSREHKRSKEFDRTTHRVPFLDEHDRQTGPTATKRMAHLSRVPPPSPDQPAEGMMCL